MNSFLGNPLSGIRYEAVPGGRRPCKVVTTGDTRLTAVNPNAEVFDGIAIAPGDRVLVRQQGNYSENGLYVVSRYDADGNVNLVRAPDANSTATLIPGITVPVTGGVEYADTFWLMDANADQIVIGATHIHFKFLFQATEAITESGLVTLRPASPDRNKITPDDPNAIALSLLSSGEYNTHFLRVGRVTEDGIVNLLTVDKDGNLLAQNLNGTNTGDQDLTDLEAKKHEHANRSALDAVEGVNTGDQDLTDLEAKKHEHANRSALDAVEGVNTGDQDLTDLEAKKHEHANMSALDAVEGVNTGDQDLTQAMIVPLSDEETALEVGDNVFAFFSPYDFQITEVNIALTTPSTNGDVTVNVKRGAMSSTWIQTLAQEEEFKAEALSETLNKGNRLTFEITAAGTGAKGLKVTILGTREE